MNQPFVDHHNHPIAIYLLKPSEVEVVSADLTPAQAAFVTAQDFKGQAGRCVVLPGDEGIAAVWFGVGDAPHPMLARALPAVLPTGVYRLAHVPDKMPTRLLALAWGLGAYRFDRYKPSERTLPVLVWPDGVHPDEVTALLDAAMEARNQINMPANDLGPDELALQAVSMANAHNAYISQTMGEALANGYPLVHAVGKGSERPPRFIEVSWGKAGPHIVVIGKGVVFDTGGLDIKVNGGMRLMKKDMGGAAHALALAKLIMGAELPVRLTLLLPLVENAVSGASFRPGDIIRSRKGLTVEIDDTDAEGRLILADALARAAELEPDLTLDFATLTGAARVALGPDVPPFYTDDEGLAVELAEFAQAEADPLWRMPLWAGYDSALDSPVADVKNLADGVQAGSVTAALFLKRFAPKGPWVHFDIYAWNERNRPGLPKGAELQAVRAVFAMLKARYA